MIPRVIIRLYEIKIRATYFYQLILNIQFYNLSILNFIIYLINYHQDAKILMGVDNWNRFHRSTKHNKIQFKQQIKE